MFKKGKNEPYDPLADRMRKISNIPVEEHTYSSVHEQTGRAAREPTFKQGTITTRGGERVPVVLKNVSKTGVRYVVWLDGSTRKTDGGGSLACGAAPGGAGCIGFGWWQKESAYEATIWDLKQAKSAGSVGTNVTGTSAIVGAIVPLPFIARVQATACNRMSNQLRSFFTGTDGIPAGTH